MSDDNKTLPAEEVIEKFGGLRPLANRLGIAASTVQGWKERGIVPENRVPEVLQAAKEDGIALDAAEQNTPEPEKTEAPEAKSDTPMAAQKSEPKPEIIDKKTDADPKPASSTSSKFMAQPDIESDRRDYSDRRNAGDRRREQDPNFKGPDRRVNDRRSGLDRRQQRAAEWQHKKKFLERSLLTFVFLFIVIMIVGVFLLLPEYNGMKKRAAEYEQMQKEMAAMNRRLETIKEERSSIGGRINEGLDQLERVKNEIMKQVQSAEQVAENMANSNWQQQMSFAEQKLYGLGSMMNQVSGLMNTPGGTEALENSLQALQQTLNQYGGNLTSQDLSAIRQEDPILATVMKDVKAEDVKAGLMLLTLNEVRSSLGRENTSFRNDLQLLQSLNNDNPEIQASIQRLAPYAESGVLSQENLSGEFQSLAGDIVMAKMRGEDASIQNRAMERLSRMMTVRRVDDSTSDTVDATVVRAQMKIDQGDISGAIAELQKLEGESAKVAAPWIADAQSRVYADQATRALTMDVMQSLMSGQSLSTDGLQSLMSRLLRPLSGPSKAVVSQPQNNKPGAIQGTYPGLAP